MQLKQQRSGSIIQIASVSSSTAHSEFVAQCAKVFARLKIRIKTVYQFSRAGQGALFFSYAFIVDRTRCEKIIL